MNKFLDRIADAGGILYVLLAFGGFAFLVAPHLPGSLDSPEAVLAHLEAHPPTTAFWAGIWMEAAGLAVLVLLAARMASRIQSAQPGWWLPSAAVGLAVAAFSVKLGSFAPGLSALATDRLDAQSVTALLSANDVAVGVSGAIDGAFVLLIGLGGLAVGGLPRWLSALAVVTGVAQIGSVAVPALGVLSLLFFVWALVASGWLLTYGARTAEPEAVAAESTRRSPA